MARPHLLLVGGGHAHLEVLRSATLRPFAAEITVISLASRQLYSGMMPGHLRGAWSEGALSVDLPALCRRANARFLEAAVTRVHATPTHVTVETSDEALHGSHCSLDIGASPSGMQTPGVTTYAHATRPREQWNALLAAVDHLASATPRAQSLPCCVVGGGAAGTELALALQARLRRTHPNASVTLISGAAVVPFGFAPTITARVTSLLQRAGIATELQATVREVTASSVRLGNGRQLDSALTIWATGASAPALIRASALPTDAEGYLSVDRTLRATSGVPVWGAGDCIALGDAPWVTKSGVYAVRAAPVLAHNLRVATSNSGAPQQFTPQRHTMFILDTADESALLCWRGVAVHSSWALRLKHSIDQRFVARYR